MVFGTISWGFESLRTRALLVQWAEHLTLNQRGEGSIPSRCIGSATHGRVLEFGRQDRLRIYWGYAS